MKHRPLSDYQLVLWDWNGTLLDDVEVAMSVANGMLAERGLPTMDRERYREIFDFPVEAYYHRAGFDVAGETFAVLAREFIDGYNARVTEAALHQNVAEVLAAVADAGLSQSILSASEEGSLVNAVRHFGIESRFEHLKGLGDHYAVSKVEAGRALMEGLGADPAQTILVGDTVHDHDVAGELGVECVLVAAGHQTYDRLAQTGAAIYQTLTDLPVTELPRRWTPDQ